MVDAVCRPDIPCFCRPLTTPELSTQHVVLGAVQLSKAAFLAVWLHATRGAQVRAGPASVAAAAVEERRIMDGGA